MKHFLPLLISYAVLLLCCPAHLSAQTPDPNYGDGTKPGVWQLSFGSSAEAVVDMAIDANGKTVLLGVADDDDEAYKSRIVVLRLNENGTLDNEFGSNGKIFIDEAGQDNQAFGLALQSDGKIVIAGMRALIYPVVYRLNANGSPDNTFSGDGRAELPNNLYGRFGSVTIQPNGAIVVGGYLSVDDGSNDSDYLVARYLSNGNLDASFGSGGFMSFDILNDDLPGPQKITLQPDGAILLTGYSEHDSGTTQDATLARVKSNGVLDPNFAFGGYWYSSSSGDDYFFDLRLMPDGSIITVGQLHESGDDYASMFKFNNKGELQTLNLYYLDGLDYDGGRGMAFDCDGNLLVMAIANNSKLGLFRVDANLAIDASFNNGLGAMITQIGYSDKPNILLTNGNKIYIGGATQPNANNFLDKDLLVLRLNNLLPCASSTQEPRLAVDIRVMPNPVSTSAQLRILSKVSTTAQLHMRNTNGRLMEEHNCVLTADIPLDINLEVTHWPAGIYYYSIDAGQGAVTGKFIVL